MKTGLNASKLAIAAFIVPYIFALNPAMLLIDTKVINIIQIIITSVMGVFALSASLEGYVFRRMTWPLRIVSAAAGLMMIDPNTLTDVVGILIICAVLFIQYIGAKRQSRSKVTA